MHKSLQVSTLHNGVYMPSIGLGTWQLSNDQNTTDLCKAAMEMGYCLIDTADCYGNQQAIGRAMKEFNPAARKFEEGDATNIPNFQTVSLKEFEDNFSLPHGKPADDRKIFITGKIFTPDFASETKMQLSYQKFVDQVGRSPDLILLHWPAGLANWGDDNAKNPQNPEIRVRCWKFMEGLYRKKLVRAIGVANYMTKHLKPLIEDIKSRPDGIIPMVNQIEISPFVKVDQDLIDLCAAAGIKFTAYSTLGSSSKKSLKNEQIEQLANKYKNDFKELTPSKLCLSWALNRGFQVIPRTSNPKHAEDNLSAKDIRLSSQIMAELDNFPADTRICPDPHNIN